MSRASQPIRLPSDAYAAAAIASRVSSRTIPQQIVHWMRIGREFEMSPTVNHRAVVQVLAGQRDYDALSEEEQALVREEWEERMDARRKELGGNPALHVPGTTYSEVDAAGNIVTHRVAE